uniref:NADPH-dependent glutamate synthase beta chain n=1 Tax=Candidatus Kentrum sp. FM TaxID=2126340 RepID=A0A450T699_9GAMM|nr:MAG: NADPH-dependent glutamate synthase beta chain [Candidatus Kentron sp. FM]VFJ62325.1 MAG: NADPH-dependent glutamate synthase beta chain [Candidatus Kentron sp. FM]VFK13239.1 MAG: NADPH-dependent glutamate synthase beta chain [Candidatus Kentron sp. FM]
MTNPLWPDTANHAASILERCLGNEPAHCQAACPLHIDNRQMIALIGEGRFDDALAVVEEKLPFPKVLGRICTRPCEPACKRQEVEEAVAIRDLKRFVADRRKLPAVLPVPGPERRERIAIVGGGPAGIMAARELRLMGYSVTVFETGDALGGAVRRYIPRYRLPREVIEEEFNRILELGVQVRFHTRLGRDVSLTALRNDFQAVLLAMGAHASVKLNIPGEALPGVYTALDLLGRVNSDRPVAIDRAIGRTVAVIGGGDAAIDAARTAPRLGASDVHVFYRRSRDEMSASPQELRDAELEGIRFHYLVAPKVIHGGAIHGDGTTGVRSLECLRMSLGSPDDSGRRRPNPIPGSEFQVPVDSVVVAIGQTVEKDYWPEGLEATPWGTVHVDPVTLRTNFPNVFAAGDVVRGADTVVDALATGRHAALSMDCQLRGQPLEAIPRESARWDSGLDMDPGNVAPEPRQRVPPLPAEYRIEGGGEVDAGFSEEAARMEAGRCLSCECRKCVEHCGYLARHGESPADLVMTLARILDDPDDEARRIPYACNLCRLCAQVCPEGLDIGAMVLSAREQLVATGAGPLRAHRPVTNHQRWSTSRLFTLSRAPRGHGTCEYVFFPGCGLPGYSPRLVSGAYEYLRAHLPDTGIVLDCCGTPTRTLGDRAGFERIRQRMAGALRRSGTHRVIVACPNCQYTIGTYMPELEVTSLYRFMTRFGPPVPSAIQGAMQGAIRPNAVFSVHDSCVARHDTHLHDSVRELIRAMGYRIEEMPNAREHARCCGIGGMAGYADPQRLTRAIRDRAFETPHDIVTYCAGCRSTLASSGKPTVHILDLFFNPSRLANKSKFREGPLSTWVNRGKTKVHLWRGERG